MGSGKSWIDDPDFEVKKRLEWWKGNYGRADESNSCWHRFDTDLSLVNIKKPLNEFSADDLLVPMS